MQQDQVLQGAQLVDQLADEPRWQSRGLAARPFGATDSDTWEQPPQPQPTEWTPEVGGVGSLLCSIWHARAACRYVFP